jgi:hypothetical protein
VNVIHQTVMSNSTSAAVLTKPTLSVATAKVGIVEQHTRLRNPTHEVMCIARGIIPYQTSLRNENVCSCRHVGSVQELPISK